MKLSCGIIRDLLPLYSEKLAGEETILAVEEHIKGCPECKRIAENELEQSYSVASEDIPQSSIKAVKNSIFKQRIMSVTLVALIVLLAAIASFCYLLRPNFLSYEESGVKLSESKTGEVFAEFSDKATSYSFNRDSGELTVWYTHWDNIINTRTPKLLLIPYNSEYTTVYFADYKNNGEVTLLLGENTVINNSESFGFLITPRLFLGFYFMVMLVSSLVLGIICFFVRRKKTAFKHLYYLFLLPLSYVLSNLILQTRLTTYDSYYEIIMMLIACPIVYPILIISSKLVKQRRLEKIL